MSRLLPIAILVALLGLAGCGDDEDGNPHEGGTEAADETVSTDGVKSTGAEFVIVGDGRGGPSFFSTPTRNIACHISKKGVRCDIRKKDWTAPPREEPCELDYGSSLQLDSSGVSFVCAGDTTLGAPKILRYRATTSRGAYSCTSHTNGITCSRGFDENSDGFILSREGYTIFPGDG